jgi:SAM-dependent methyltransferase
MNAASLFFGLPYQRHNARRLEHLASLGLPLSGKTVLELGAGVGDHSTFFLDRGCSVVSVEPRQENIRLMKERAEEARRSGYAATARWRMHQASVESLASSPVERADIVYCYGLLYHLADPAAALRIFADACKELLLIETCVSFGADEAINPVAEPHEDPTQSFAGKGCRPTRLWVFNRLKALLPFVYVPRTQPAHEEFPLDWTVPAPRGGQLTRAIFIGARTALSNPLLLDYLPDRHTAT